MSPDVAEQLALRATSMSATTDVSVIRLPLESRIWNLSGTVLPPLTVVVPGPRGGAKPMNV
ncbi:MAG: hypothetical protein DMD78_25515 [Candidatus Rokuibacteriota bacterium]|nr:MAG: hypothetical protein DMD78_25515 [Candidatus Rokubacteria bacterium]